MKRKEIYGITKEQINRGNADAEYKYNFAERSKKGPIDPADKSKQSYGAAVTMRVKSKSGTPLE